MGEATSENSWRMSTIQHNESSEDIIASGDHAASEPDDAYREQSSRQIIPLLVSIFVTMFLVALDRTIISTVRLQFHDLTPTENPQTCSLSRANSLQSGYTTDNR